MPLGVEQSTRVRAVQATPDAPVAANDAGRKVETSYPVRTGRLSLAAPPALLGVERPVPRGRIDQGDALGGQRAARVEVVRLPVTAYPGGQRRAESLEPSYLDPAARREFRAYWWTGVAASLRA